MVQAAMPTTVLSRAKASRTPDSAVSPRQPGADAFEELLSLAQACTGVRINAHVAGLIPDGRGLSDIEPDAREQRVSTLRQDAVSDEAGRRQATRASANEDGQTFSARAKRADNTSSDTQRPTENAGTATPTEGSPRAAAAGTPMATGRTADSMQLPSQTQGESPGPPTQSNAVSARASTALSRGDAPRAVEPPVSPAPSATPVTSTPAVSGPAMIDSASLAKQVADALGAKVSSTAGRASSVHQAAPAADTAPGKPGRTDTTQTPARSERAPSRSPETESNQATRRAAFDRLVRSIRMNIGARQSTARLHLNPPELGRVRVDVRLVDQRLDLAIRTQTHDAREILGSRLQGLCDALSAHGVTVERVELLPPETDGQPQVPLGQEQASGNNAQRSADDSTEQSQAPADETVRDDGDMASGGDPADQGYAAAETRLDVRA